MKRFLFTLGLLSFYGLTFSQPLPEGPADDSAYWILNHLGEKLKPLPVLERRVINFGTVPVGEEKVETLKILNKGYGDLKILEIFLQTGTDFAIKKTSCTKPIPPGHACEIWIAFKPTAPGKLTDMLVINTNSEVYQALSVKLIGEAVGAEIEQPPVIPVVPLPKEQPAPPKKEKEQPKVKKSVAKPKKEKKLVPKYRIWTVKPCDTLWDISTAAYGTPLLWAAIYEANKNKIRDPWILKVGQKLRIPVLTKKEAEKYRKETVELMQEMADRPLGPKCP